MMTVYPSIHVVAEYDVTKEKQRLQNLMTYGSDMAPVTHTVSHDTDIEEKDRFDEGIYTLIKIYVGMAWMHVSHNTFEKPPNSQSLKL